MWVGRHVTGSASGLAMGCARAVLMHAFELGLHGCRGCTPFVGVDLRGRRAQFCDTVVVSCATGNITEGLVAFIMTGAVFWFACGRNVQGLGFHAFLGWCSLGNGLVQLGKIYDFFPRG